MSIDAAYAQPGDLVLEHLGTTADGLSSAEAKRRLAATGPNELPEQPRASAWRRFVGHFDDELVQSHPQVEDFLVQLSQKRLSANAAAVQPAELIDADAEVIEI